MLKEIRPDEAFLLFEKLRTEQSTVLLMGTFSGYGLLVKGRIFLPSGVEVGISSPDGLAAFRFRLDLDDLRLWYGEPKDMPEPERNLVPEYAKDSACVSVALPLRVSPAEVSASSYVPRREKLFFIELREGVEDRG